MQQAIDLLEKPFHDFFGDIIRIIFQDMVDADEEVGEWVKPGKPGVLLKQEEQAVDRSDRPVDVFIGLLFSDDEGAVQSDQAFSNREHLTAANIDWNEGRCGG